MENPVNGTQADCSGPVLPRCDDYEAFTLLYRQTAAAIHTYLHRLCGCPQLAEDLLQETFLAAFQGRSSPRTWLYVIATNKFRDHCRKGWGRFQIAPEKLEALPSPGPAPPEAAIQKEESRRIREAILALPSDLRAALLLVRFEGLKYRAAAALGTTPATVRMQIHRTHRLLAQSLGEEPEMDRDEILQKVTDALCGELDREGEAKLRAAMAADPALVAEAAKLELVWQRLERILDEEQPAEAVLTRVYAAIVSQHPTELSDFYEASA